ncbi:hypothetical protein L6452_13198 [Arctium lappa]|uniref:Uncharacterized protein n=1 Tax=Arctium lappa TaxID=4217 RepID=A0ACB9CHW5_ARCLA|nr:hypothetical protein L6452_13198 [Arctium lappa]
MIGSCVAVDSITFSFCLRSCFCMGTQVQSKSSFEGYYSMRDVNEDSNSSSWPLFYGEKPLTNGHYYNGFIPRSTIADAHPGYDKDALKQKMLEHEDIFKKQVSELHRLYKRQRDMMEDVKRKEFHKHRVSNDASSSSSLLPSQKPYDKWQVPSFPLANSTCARPSIFGAEISNNSPLSCSKGNNSSKDCEVVECRPSKVRKKLFDLELPPDENIDHEENEQIQYKQASEESSYKGTSSGQCFRGSNGLADLNEPIHVEETIGQASVDGLKPTVSQFLGSTHEFFEKSQSGRPSGAFNPLALEGKGNGRDWLSNTRETGNSRSNTNFTPGTYSEISTRIQDHSRFNQTPLPFATSRTSGSYPFVNSSDLGNSWGKPNGSLTHKLTSFQKQPSFLSSPQSHVVFGDKWRTNGCYSPNGIYRGSSSGSKEPLARLPSGGFDNRNCNNNLEDRSQKIFKGSNFIDLTDTTKGMDLNTVETVSNDDNIARKGNQTVMPWLRATPAICKNDSPCDQSKNGEKGDDSLANNGKILGFPVFGNSCVSKNDSSSLVSTSASLHCPRENGKIKKEIMEHRGFDINVAWDDPENKQIDPEASNLEKETDTEIEKIKNHFDLNSCVTEDEDFLVPESVKSSSEKTKKITMEIDFEAPAVPEVEEETAIDEVEKLDVCEDEELAKVAAEAIIEISGQQDQAGPKSEVAIHSDDNERLLWFAEVIGNAGPVSNELDEFEELTLQVEETKEEDYMPKPLAPDFREPDEAGLSTVPTRPRRGQARRGRPRRDFQRDILPGLVSLSRHEVTEDLQIFGGMMRATGHSWNVGLTRRNGTRGRRKAVAVAVEPPPAATPPPPPPPPPSPPPPPPLSEQLNNMEMVGLEERSLTGWGKTTRRPRRQRCAAGSSVAVPLT